MLYSIMTFSKREPKETSKSYEISGQTISFKSWILAPQADSAVTMQRWDNVLLFTIVMESDPRPELDFLPLTIDWREMYSAAGKIGWAAYRRREWRPSDTAVLYARLTDRALRPLFPKWMINGVVVSVTPLSVDLEQDLWVMSLVGSSLAVWLAGIPFKWPVGAVRITRKDDQFIINPSKEEVDAWEMNLICAGRRWSINMIELDAKMVSDEIVDEALKIAQKEIDKMITIQEDFLSQFKLPVRELTFNKPSQDLLDAVKNLYTQDKQDAMLGQNISNFNVGMKALEDEALEQFAAELEDDDNVEYTASKIKMAVFETIQNIIRNRTLTKNIRIDERWLWDIRPLYTSIDEAPRAHGSGLFWRGDTQVLSSVTLWSVGDALLLDDMENDHIDTRYFHHYNFPPFSVGDARPVRFVSRREIWHGHLAWKALEPVLPNKDEFPYTIRVVSDCLSSGGSTSMGATCGSTLWLMAAGVPISNPVSGIAMGLIAEQDDDGNITNYKILTDLMGLEDFMGDMDFKVAGTRDGITAIQLDTKLQWLSYEIIKETIAQAHIGRNEILWVMLETISEPRKELSPYAPKMAVIQVAPDKVKLVIGKWGEMIDKIIEEAGGVKIDFDDDGTCYIAHTDQTMIDCAITLIKDIAEDLPLNTPVEWVVSKVEKYGFFIDLPKKESWLVHISQLGKLSKPSVDVHFKEGQKVMIIATGRDSQGRLQLKLA